MHLPLPSVTGILLLPNARCTTTVGRVIIELLLCMHNALLLTYCSDRIRFCHRMCRLRMCSLGKHRFHMQRGHSDAWHYRQTYSVGYYLLGVLYVFRCLHGSTRVDLTSFSCPIEGALSDCLCCSLDQRNTAQSAMTPLCDSFLDITGQRKLGLCQVRGMNNI